MNDCQNVPHESQKRRAIVIDLLLGIGIPLIGMVLRTLIPFCPFRLDPFTTFPEYVCQGHRFDIWEDVGCFPYTYNTIVGLFLVSVPPLTIAAVSAVYRCM